MFVLFFSLFIFLSSTFENIFIVLAAFILCSIIICIIHKPNKHRQFWLCILSFLLAISSVRLYNFRYNHTSDSSLSTKDYIGTGQISDRQWQSKYTIQNWNNTYSLISKNDYQIGDQLRLVGNIKYTKYTNNTQLSWIFHYQFNYDKRLKMKGIQGTIFEQNAIIMKNPTSSKLWFIRSLRAWLQNLVQKSYTNSKVAWLVLGMLIGDRSQIPKSDYQSFIDSWLVHLIAVSGGNIIMIVVFLWFILFRLPFYFRNFLILLCIIIYGLLCGMDSSVFRAVIMWWLGMIALFRGRQIDVRRSLSIAFIAMLLYNPYYLVYDVGFLFSFSAIIWLVYFHKTIASKPPQLAYIRNNYLSLSIGATIGIFPTMIFFMGKINLLGIIGNLFVLPIVPIVMIYGFISTLLYQIIPRYGFIQIESRLINYIYRVSAKTWEYWLYMNVEGDRIKYLILFAAILRFIQKRLKNTESSQGKKPIESKATSPNLSHP